MSDDEDDKVIQLRPTPLDGDTRTVARCTAKSKRTGQRCGQYPPPGQATCKWHGGAAPQVKQKAAERVTEQKARKEYARLSDMPVEAVTDAVGELTELAGEVKRWRTFVRDRMDHLESHRYEGLTAEQIRGEVTIYQDAMKTSLQVLGVLAKLGIEDRLAAVNEKVGAAIEQVLLAAFTDPELAMTEEQRATAPVVIRRALEAVA